jgi:hypothetical protein
MKKPPEKLPDPWLFHSETLLRELDRCRELVMKIRVSDLKRHTLRNQISQSTQSGISSRTFAICSISTEKDNANFLAEQQRKAPVSLRLSSGTRAPLFLSAVVQAGRAKLLPQQ